MTETNDQIQSNAVPGAADVPAAAEGQQERRGGRGEGKGIKYAGERILRKAGKTGKK